MATRSRLPSPSKDGARRIWQRDDLETMTKRLKALDATIAREGLFLAEARVIALKKAKTEKEAHGPSSSASARAIAAPRTIPTSGIMKGVGRIYQQTFVDTYL